MTEKTYFVVSNDDGDVRVRGPMSAAQVLEDIDTDADPEYYPVWLDAMPNDL
jgi:hypothetical protein